MGGAAPAAARAGRKRAAARPMGGADSGGGPSVRPPPRIDPGAEANLLDRLRHICNPFEQGEAMRVLPGMLVVALCDFQSDSERRVWLLEGERGSVIKADERGDVLVDFASHAKSQWVFQSTCCNLRFQDRPLAGLALLAPFTSVADVVKYHTTSGLAASLVGPMWEVLRRVSDRVMGEVPLLVLHPKSDEIVPGKHGMAVYEQAASRQKYGVWLCNATHNVTLEEEHFAIARPFMNASTAYGQAVIGLDADAEPRSPVGRPKDLKLGTGTSGDPESVPPALSVFQQDQLADQLISIGVSGLAEEMVMLSL